MTRNNDPRSALLLGLFGQGVLDLEQIRRWGTELGLSSSELRELLGRCIELLTGEDGVRV